MISKKIRSPVTDLDRRAIEAISPGKITYMPGIATKRFARDIQNATELTDAQRIFLWDVVWKFRRQIPDKMLVREAEATKHARVERTRGNEDVEATKGRAEK